MVFNLLLFLAFYLPFQIALNPTPGIDLASSRVIILIIFFMWLAESLRKKKLIIKNNPQTWLILIFLFLNFFSIFFAQNNIWGQRKLLFLFSCFPLYFVAADILKTPEKVLRISKALIFSGVLAAGVGLAQFFSQFIFSLSTLQSFWGKFVTPIFLGHTFSQAVLTYPSWLVNISGATYFRAISFFPDPHMFSMYLGMILPLSLALYFKENKNRWIIFSLIIILADILTFSRGAYLALFSGFLGLAFLAGKKLNQKYFRSLAFILIFLTLSLFLIPNPISSRFYSSFDAQEGSNAGRLMIWQKALKIIADYPFFGTGLGNFPLAINPQATYREPIYAHNTYLDIAVETGIFSALIWIGLIFSSFLSFIKLAKNDIIFSGAAFSLIIFSVHSLVDTGLYSPVVLSVFLLILSFTNISSKCAKPI